MQKISTQVFIYASVAFGIIGLCLALFGGPDDNAPVNQVLMRMLMACIFIILPSFALSIAAKYLGNK
jgi:tetrahydromethanopterin S-methyltransferase subunit C